MALGTFIAGRYTATKNSVAIGLTREGFRVSLNSKGEAIDRSDGYGDALIDWIYRGGEAFNDWIAKEYAAPNISAIWPYGSRGVLSDTTTPVGRLASAIADALVLTAVANTPAGVAAAPATHTATLTLIAQNFNVETLFDSRLRELPLRMQYIPAVASGSKVVWFSET